MNEEVLLVREDARPRDVETELARDPDGSDQCATVKAVEGVRLVRKRARLVRTVTHLAVRTPAKKRTVSAETARFERARELNTP